MKCYVISHPRQNIIEIIELLNEKSIAFTHTLLDIDINPMDSIENAIKESDFVIFMFNQTTNTNQFYELGLAKGLQKPIFIIVEDNSLLPFCAERFMYVKANTDNIEAISYNLDLFLNNATKKRNIRKYQGNKIKTNKNDILPDLNTLVSNIYKENLSEKYIIETIEKILSCYEDITVVSQNRNLDKGADFALWIDEVENTLGGPILIEVKKSINQHTKYQMADYLQTSKSPAGIVIYIGDKNDYEITDNKQLPLIIYMELRTFIQYTTERKLAKLLIDRRNDVVHKGGFNG